MIRELGGTKLHKSETGNITSTAQGAEQQKPPGVVMVVHFEGAPEDWQLRSPDYEMEFTKTPASRPETKHPHDIVQVSRVRKRAEIKNPMSFWIPGR
jgi:hypothetical protein